MMNIKTVVMIFATIIALPCIAWLHSNGYSFVATITLYVYVFSGLFYAVDRFIDFTNKSWDEFDV